MIESFIRKTRPEPHKIANTNITIVFYKSIHIITFYQTK